MTKKPTTLSAAMAKKPSASPEPAIEPPAGEVRTLTLRLPPIVHDQLREMAFKSRKSQHSLLLEALNDLFVKHGKPPIAS